MKPTKARPTTGRGVIQLRNEKGFAVVEVHLARLTVPRDGPELADLFQAVLAEPNLHAQAPAMREVLQASAEPQNTNEQRTWEGCRRCILAACEPDAERKHYGTDLQAGVGYLKRVSPLTEDPQDGLTQADLDAAMDAADTKIEALLADDYDTSDWLASAPPLVAMLWEMLAAAKVLEFAELRLGQAAGGLADKIIHGIPERLHLRDAAGNLIRPRKAPAADKEGER